MSVEGLSSSKCLGRIGNLSGARNVGIIGSLGRVGNRMGSLRSHGFLGSVGNMGRVRNLIYVGILMKPRYHDGRLRFRGVGRELLLLLLPGSPTARAWAASNRIVSWVDLQPFRQIYGFGS